MKIFKVIATYAKNSAQGEYYVEAETAKEAKKWFEARYDYLKVCTVEEYTGDLTGLNIMRQDEWWRNARRDIDTAREMNKLNQEQMLASVQSMQDRVIEMLALLQAFDNSLTDLERDIQRNFRAVGHKLVDFLDDTQNVRMKHEQLDQRQRQVTGTW